MRFEDQLELVLPPDLPNRERLVRLGATHLHLIAEANESFNLTRILHARDAAIKHVLDSAIPWRHFAQSGRVLDAGTGAGFPGIPLSIVLPDVRFTLAESVGKKARFVEAAVEALALPNVIVVHARAEEFLLRAQTNVITGRAVAPLDRACALFAPAIRDGARAIFYKGPDVDAEIAVAGVEARKGRLAVRVIDRYSLPDSMGSRTLVEIRGTA